ncbi:GDSL-like Lipase/Acylhydrolase [Brevibacillus sp. IT-7CA2]|uniref:SGNH/GDSL hydrolase family protein n=1 Tax=Brevibacillus sp. IT-7CA2 TaxID=3026436 RepID=UPI0039E049F8
MNILILGDSLALPRPHRINNFDPIQDKELAVHFNETYGFLLEKELRSQFTEMNFTVTNRAQRFSTIKNISEQFTDHLFFFQPDVIVMQVGIVDCWFREELGGKQIVEIEEFEQYYKKIISLVELRPQTKLIVIGICKTSLKMEQRYPGTLTQISLYNDILKNGENHSQVFFIDMETHIEPSDPHVYLLPDDHHLNKRGNLLVSTFLLNIIIAFYENIAGCNAFETEIDTSYKHFTRSFGYYPYYGDNLYNLIYLSFQMQDLKKTTEYIKFVRENKIKHTLLPQLVDMIKEQIK